MITQYDQGDQVRVSATFADIDTGAATDPTNVYFDFLEKADGTLTQYTYGIDSQLVRDSTGVYHVDINTGALSGMLVWRFYSTGAAQYAADEGSFYVKPSEVHAAILAAQPSTAEFYDILGTDNQITVIGGSGAVVSGDVTLSIPASSRLSIGRITNLTTNGIVMTGSSNGTLSVATMPIGTYTVTNVSTDRAYNANSTTVDELADVLGTLIADLRAANIVA